MVTSLIQTRFDVGMESADFWQVARACLKQASCNGPISATLLDIISVINQIPDDKILGWSKFNLIADDI